MIDFLYTCPRHQRRFVEAVARGGCDDPRKMDEVGRKTLAWLSTRYARVVLDHFNERSCLGCKLEANGFDVAEVERAVTNISTGLAPDDPAISFDLRNVPRRHDAMVDKPLPIEEATRDQRLLRLYRYWNERRGDRPFPAPKDIDPADYAYALEMVSIIEVHRDPLRFRYRLVSTQLTEHLGYEMTGKYVDDIPEPSMRQFTRAFYERALERQAPLHEAGAVLIRRDEWWHETLVLPLASDGNNIDMLLIYRNTVSPVAVTRSHQRA